MLPTLMVDFGVSLTKGYRESPHCKFLSPTAAINLAKMHKLCWLLEPFDVWEMREMGNEIQLFNKR